MKAVGRFTVLNLSLVVATLACSGNAFAELPSSIVIAGGSTVGSPGLTRASCSATPEPIMLAFANDVKKCFGVSPGPESIASFVKYLDAGAFYGSAVVYRGDQCQVLAFKPGDVLAINAYVSVIEGQAN